MKKENELMIVFGNAGYVYFKTGASTAREALDEFESALGGLCDSSNLPYEDYVTEAVLRDENYEDLDSVKF